MSAEVVMPRLSDSMVEGTVVRWFKQVGDQVAMGDPLVEIETDKATVTYEADAAGTLLEIAVREGETVPLGAVIARIGGTAETPLPASPGRVDASPVARRLARERGIELATLQGTGPNGRVVKADVEAAAARPAPASQEGARGAVEVVALSRVQQTIARRMAESKATIPDFTLYADVDMSRCVELRGTLGGTADGPPSYNDMIVKAAALALREHPKANGAYKDGRVELYGRVNVGIAVALDDGLVVPTIFDADRKSLGEIAREARRLAAAVRDATVTPPELTGGTFTVSNLGMYGIDFFTAIVNPGQAAILSVGAITKRPLADAQGELAVRDALTLGLICDHRILYGADAAQFLSRIRQLLEQPMSLAP
jgi:pyruvate dehydrogenase E2 component (dihydrolipoamide acetyltransferase)